MKDLAGILEFKTNRNYEDFLLALGSVIVLIIVSYYIFANAFFNTYPGFSIDGQWKISGFEDGCLNNPNPCNIGPLGLEIGDQLVKIDGLTFQEFESNPLSVPFKNIETGSTFDIIVLKNGEPRLVHWITAGPVLSEIIRRILSLSAAVFSFWLAGTIVLFLLRPRGTLWRLLVVFNYLMALWLVFGFVSSSRLAGSAVLTRLLSWVLIPVFLHFHLLVPPKILHGPRQNRFIASFYAILAALMVWSALNGFPSTPAYLGLAVAILVSVGSLVWRITVKRQDTRGNRLAVQIMLAGVSLAFGPAIVLWAIPSLIGIPTSSGLVLSLINASLIVLPFFYIYALYKRSLGNLEFRANRVLSSYSFLLIFATTFILVFLVANNWLDFARFGVEVSLIISIIFVTLAIYIRPAYQRLVDRFFYGTTHNSEQIVSDFANEIPRALSRDALVGLLTDQVTPSLLIRQSALIDESRATPRLFYAEIGLAELPTLTPESMAALHREVGRYRPPNALDVNPPSWVRLALPVQVGGKVLGLWLFGRRDPDDFYPQPDISLLKTLSNQIGIALETIRLVDDLRQRADELEKAYNELRELDKLKEEFVQNISHELRTPLTLIHGYTELLNEGLLGEVNEDQMNALAVILERTDLTIRMVEDIISVQQAMLEELHLQPLELHEIAQQSLRLAEITSQQLASQMKPGAVHTFSLNIEDDAPPIYGDPKRMQQVFENLLSNAVKFSPDGGLIQVQIKGCHHRFRNAQDQLVSLPAVEVCIQDQGVGIPADQRDRIWERFFQVDGSSTRKFGGMGLGLSIVADAIQAHNGFLWVESEVDKGSKFFFVLPTVESAQQLEQDSTAKTNPLDFQSDLPDLTFPNEISSDLIG